jgi:DNA-binding CsgD family transcriptional regulator
MGKIEAIWPPPRRKGSLVLRDAPESLLELLAAGDPPAFATDSRDRIVFWNRGMADLVRKTSGEVLGQRCYDTLGGRDVFGNRFCYANCPVVATLREGDAVCGFELRVAASGSGSRAVNVTILKIPGVRPDLFTLVHIFHPIAEDSRLARLLAGLAGTNGDNPSPGVGAATGAPPLTPREAEILRHVAEGLQNKEIAQKLELSVATVRNHIHNILNKLGVHSKLEAVSLAFRNGWVSANAGPSYSAMPSVPDESL